MSDAGKGCPDHVKCVIHTDLPRKGTTWCGRKHYNMEWLFTDVDHAALTREQESRLLVCPECRNAIVKALDTP